MTQANETETPRTLTAKIERYLTSSRVALEKVQAELAEARKVLDVVSIDFNAALIREVNLSQACIAVAQRAEAAEQALSAAQQRAGELERDAARWNRVLMKVGGIRNPGGSQSFTVGLPEPLPGKDIMRGSVAEHFTDAIDAALRGQEGSDA